MSGFYSKPVIVSVFVMTASWMVHGQSNENYTAIRNANIQIKGSLNQSPLAWATDTITILLNKLNGQFEARLLVDDLHYATSNPDFMGATGENTGKYLSLTGVIPVYEVLDNQNSMIDREIEITASFNGIDYPTTFTFTIIALQGRGFSVMANGNISHRMLEIQNLAELDDELLIILSFTGY